MGDAANVSVILGIWKLFMTGIAVSKVDSLGRRPLVLGGISIIIMFVCICGAEHARRGANDGASASVRRRHLSLCRRVSVKFRPDRVVARGRGLSIQGALRSRRIGYAE